METPELHPRKRKRYRYVQRIHLREDEDGFGNGTGTVAGAVYVRDNVNLKAAATAARWAHEGPRKWAFLAGFEAVTLLIMFITASLINPFLALAFIPVLAAGFGPQVITNHLLKTDKMIILDSFSGWGSQWQSELHRGFAQLERLTREARDPEAPAEVVAAFSEIEPVLWAQALKISALLNKLQQGGTADLDSDTKRILRKKLVEFKAQVDKIDEVFKIVHSFSVLDLDTSVEELQLETIVGYLNDGLSQRKELASGSPEETPVDALIDDIAAADVATAGSSMDTVLAKLKGDLEAKAAAQKAPVQKASAA